MKRRTLFIFCLIAALGNAAGSSGQDVAKGATVIFYSHGNWMTSGLPGSKNGVFYGVIFDGAKRLFSFQEGFVVKNNRVISFTFQPGPHTFVASYGKTPVHGGKLTLTLQPGKTYFVRTESHSNGVVVVEFEKGHLDQVSCEVARKDTENAKPLTGKKVSPQMAANVIPTLLPIICP